VRPWVATLAGTAAIDAYTREAAGGDTACEQTAESQRIDLALARGSTGRAERIASAVIHVLIVQKDDDALQYRTAHWRAPKPATKSPACAGEPGRRGGLTEVYTVTEVAQQGKDRAKLTMRAEAMTRQSGLRGE